MSRILVIRGGAIGDFILTLPALKLLRDSFPSAHLEVLGYPHIAVLATMSGYADATRSIDYAALSSFFTRAGDLAPGLIDYFGSFQQVISYLFDPDGIFADNLKRAGVRHLLVGSPKITDREHAARQLARPLEGLALYLRDPAARLHPPGNGEIDAAALAIHPGSGSESKNWPVERFAEVARGWLTPGVKRKVVLVGGEADESRVEILRANLPGDRVELAQNLALPQLAGRLRRCGLFLGHDSGISHLAASVGTRALLLFGPSDPAIWAPANPQIRVLRGPGRTMAEIEAPAVLRAISQMAVEM